MKTRTIRKNDIVVTTATGTLYKVVSIGVDYIMINEVVGREVPGSRISYEETGEVKSVNKPVFYELFEIVDKAPAETPAENEFEIKDGRLYHNGEKVETGSLYAEEIKARVPGGLILSVRSLVEGKHDLFYYDPEQEDPDEAFDKLTRAKDGLELVYQDGPLTGFITTEREEVPLPPEKDGDDPKVVEKVWQTVRFYDGKNWSSSSDDDEDQNPLIGRKIYERREESADVLLFATDEKVEFVDGAGWVIDQSAKGKRTTVSRIVITYPEGRDGRRNADLKTVAFNGTIQKILPSYDEDKNFVFVTEEGVVHTNYGHSKLYAKGAEVLSAVQEYPQPAGLIFGGRKITTFLFTNADYSGVVKIRVEKKRESRFRHNCRRDQVTIPVPT